MNQIYLVSISAMGGIGIFFGVLLAYSSKKFAVEKDERIEKIEEILPGANCGACGHPGCTSYSEAIVNQAESIQLCTVGGAKTATKIGDIMGVLIDESLITKVACVKCQGGFNCLDSFEYKGVEDCHTASLMYRGQKSCKYGCLGLKSCMKICPFNAITMNQFGVAQIDIDRCNGCELCIRECPKGIIEMVPNDKSVHVICKNKETAKTVKPKCKVGCIGCKLCERVCEQKAIEVKDNLAKINYNLCTGCNACVIKCPVKAINTKTE